MPTSADFDAASHLDKLVGGYTRLLVRAGGGRSEETIAQTMGTSRAEVQAMRQRGELLGVTLGSDWIYPVCQFEHGTPIPHLAEFLRVCTKDSWEQLEVLMSTPQALGGRKLFAALRSESPELAEEALRIAADSPEIQSGSAVQSQPPKRPEPPRMR